MEMTNAEIDNWNCHFTKEPSIQSHKLARFLIESVWCASCGQILSADCVLDIVGSTVLRWNETSNHHLLSAVCFAGTALFCFCAKERLRVEERHPLKSLRPQSGHRLRCSSVWSALRPRLNACLVGHIASSSNCSALPFFTAITNITRGTKSYPGERASEYRACL